MGLLPSSSPSSSLVTCGGWQIIKRMNVVHRLLPLLSPDEEKEKWDFYRWQWHTEGEE